MRASTVKAVLLQASLASAAPWWLRLVGLGNSTETPVTPSLDKGLASAASSPLPPTSWPGKGRHSTSSRANGTSISSTRISSSSTSANSTSISSTRISSTSISSTSTRITSTTGSTTSSHGYQISITLPDPFPTTKLALEARDDGEEDDDLVSEACYCKEKATIPCTCLATTTTTTTSAAPPPPSTFTTTGSSTYRPLPSSTSPPSPYGTAPPCSIQRPWPVTVPCGLDAGCDAVPLYCGPAPGVEECGNKCMYSPLGCIFFTFYEGERQCRLWGNCTCSD